MQANEYSRKYRGAPSLIFRDVASHPADFSNVPPFRLQNNPMLLLAVCFAAGVLCRPWWQPPFAVVAVCAGMLFTALVARVHAPRMAWPATAMAFVVLGWAAALLQPSRQDTSLLRYADGLQRTLDAQVLTTRVVQRQADLNADRDFSNADDPVVEREILTVRAIRIEDVQPDTSMMRKATGNVLITLVSRDALRAIPYLGCGSHIQLAVRMHAPQRYRTPGAWNYSETMELDGTSAISLADITTVRPLEKISAPLQCRFLAAQHWSSERIASLARAPWMRHFPRQLRFTAADASVLRAMLLGDRSDLDKDLRIDFERTASFHLFVVAGVHITLLISALYLLLRRFGVPLWAAIGITIPAVTAYAILTGFGEPVQRASLMSVVFLITTAIDRERQLLNALGVAALVMLLLDPHALTEASFQMTALSVIAIGGIAVPLLGRTFGPCARALNESADVSLDVFYPPCMAQLCVSARMAGRLLVAPSWKRSVPFPQRIPSIVLRGLLLAVEVSLLTLVAEMVMALPMSVYFHRLTPFGVPANMLALPLIGALLTAAMATFVLAIIYPLLAAVPLIVTALLLHAVNGTIHAFSTLHGADIRMPGPETIPVALALCLWCFAMISLREWQRRIAYVGIAALLLAFAVILLPPRPHIAHDGMTFTAIDVGQGDSLFVTTPGGQTLLLDAGGPTGPAETAARSRFDTGEDVVSPYLWHEKLRRVDVLAVTHAHSDHLGGALAVLRNFQPHEVWLSVPSPSAALQQLVDEAHQRNITIRYLRDGDVQQLGPVRITALSPTPSYTASAEPSNDDSLVLRLQYGRSSVLAMGDAERDAEATMLTRPMAQVTLLKVGHHGSNTSTTQDLLQQVYPQYAVISCGRENRFGHPRMPVLQRLQAMKVSTSRTDTIGTVSYVLRDDGSVTVSTPSQ